MISKKLLSEVLGYPFCSIVEIKVSSDEKSLLYTTYEAPRSVGKWKQINIYELAWKCKEWAIQYECRLSSEPKYSKHTDARCDVLSYKIPTSNLSKSEFFTADTEPEAIFKACEWILKQKEKEL